MVAAEVDRVEWWGLWVISGPQIPGPGWMQATDLPGRPALAYPRLLLAMDAAANYRRVGVQCEPRPLISTAFRVVEPSAN